MIRPKGAILHIQGGGVLRAPETIPDE